MTIEYAMRVSPSLNYQIDQVAGKLWEELAHKLPIQLPNKLWEEVFAQYDAAHRFYHTTQHLASVFDEYSKVKEALNRQEEFAFALLFHDFIYEPAHADNQTSSAKIARTVLAAIGYDMDRDYVERLILLSSDRHKMSPKLTSKAVTPEEALFLDCDQWVLAADSDTYAAYLNDLEHECVSLGTTKFKLNRKLWLNKMLNFDRIFLSDQFSDREAAARQNLQAEMERRTMKLRNGKLIPSDD